MKRFPYLLHGIVLVVLVLFDQLSKYFVRRYIKAKPLVLIEDVFSFYYHENRGSVWGILQGKVDLLLIASLFLFAAMIYVYIKMPKEKFYLPLFWIIVFMAA